MKTTKFIRKTNINREWFLVDAKDQVLGKLCSNIAKILRGKHKPAFTPNSDTGDFVVIVNAEKVSLTGKKRDSITYSHFSGYPGGLKTKKFNEVLTHHPKRIITNAVKGMLPHNKLGRAMIKKLKVYSGKDHPHKAQNPQAVTITKEKK